MFYAWPRPVEFVFKIVITDCIGTIVAYDQISFCGCEQFSVSSAFQFGVDSLLTGTSALSNKSLNSFSQPEFVYQIDVEPVAKVCFHRLMACQVGLGLNEAVGGIDLNNFSVVAFSLVPVDFSHCPGRDIIDYKALNS